MKSIQNKILFVVITGLLIITAVVSTIAVTMTHEIMHKDADRILGNAAQLEAALINDALGDVIKSCNIMKHYTVAEARTVAHLQDESFRTQFLQDAEIMFSEIALNTSGVEGFYLRLDPAVSNGTTGFYLCFNEANTLQHMPLTDLSKYEKNDKQNVGWYYDAVMAGKGVWLDPYFFPNNEDELITYAEPMYIGQDLIGVVGFDMNFSYLCQRIDNISVYESGYAVLLAKDGVTAYTQTEVPESRNPHAGTKATLKNGMYLSLHADYKDIQRNVRPMLSNIVYAFLIVLCCAILYTIYVTRRIVKPLKKLTATAQGIALGNNQMDAADLLVDSNDEIGALSQVLSASYAKIREHTAYINALAYRDSLTGVKNTTAYTEAVNLLNQEIYTGCPKFAVLVADINNLKETNDKFGHDIGDNLIVCTAKILTELFQNSSVFRIGGDEFAVILQNKDYEQYRTLLKHLDAACSSAHISVGEQVIPVAVARGVSLFDPSIDRVYQDVFTKADHAMYINKEESKSSAL